MRPNFLPSKNPFSLSTPPDWFLDELAAHDPDARVFASEVMGVYRLGRKARRGPAMLGLLRHPDAEIMRRHGLVPATSIMPTSVGMDWAKVLIDLFERDTWAIEGGADRAADQLDEWDREEEKRLKLDADAELDQRSHDAYITLKGLGGERVGMAIRKDVSGRSTTLRRQKRTYRPVGAGTGAMWARQRGEALRRPA